MRHALSVTLALLTSGCFLSRDAGDDSGTADGGADVLDGMCSYLASYQRCDDQCATCPPRSNCIEAPICVTASDPLSRRNGCLVPLQGEDAATGFFCFDGKPCLNIDEPEQRGERVRGSCVDDIVCQQLHLEPGNERFVCRYFDGSPYVDGPPTLDACPEIAPGVPGESAFCGGPCGECLPVISGTGFAGTDVGCVGVDEDHAFGVCTMLGGSSVVECETTRTLRDYETFYDPIATPHGATCMRLLREDGSPHQKGWLAFRDACESYVRMFPGRFECSRPTE